MKNIRKVITIFLLIIIYAYIVNVSNFPNKILIYKDSNLKFKLCPFLNLNGEVQTVNSEKANNYNLNLSLGNVKLKNVELTVVSEINVVPVGKLIGLRLYTDGVMIVRIFRNRRYKWKSNKYCRK